MKKINYKKFIIILNVFLITIFIFSLGTTFSYLAEIYTGDILRGTLNLTSGRVTQIIPYVEKDFNIEVTDDNFLKDGYNLGSTSKVGTKLMAGEGEYLNITYNIYLNIIYNDLEYTTSTNESELILSIRDSNGDNVEYIDDSNFPYQLDYTHVDEYKDEEGRIRYGDSVYYLDITEESGQILLIEGVNIQAGSFDELVESYYTVSLYLLNLDTNQIQNESKSFEAELVVEIVDNTTVPNYLNEMIIESNGGKSYIDNLYFDYNNIYDDMYAKEDDYGTTYFNTYEERHNYVFFAGFYWQIMRVNGDGSTKLIYLGTEIQYGNNGFSFNGIETIGISPFNSIDSSESVGYMYEEGLRHGYKESSDVKIVIDSWYEKYLSGHSDYIADSLYCNDRTILEKTPESILWYDNVGMNSEEPFNVLFYYNKGAYLNQTYSSTARISNYITESEIEFKCNNKNDAFTVDDEINGNGALTYPIGLATIDDLFFSSLEMISKNPIWTMSPGYSLDNHHFMITPKTDISYLFQRMFPIPIIPTPTNYTNANGSIVPVINLKPDVKVTGYGSYDEPYIVQGRG